MIPVLFLNTRWQATKVRRPRKHEKKDGSYKKKLPEARKTEGK
jgi:hypothetical protein